MQVIRVSAAADADGMIRLNIPVGAAGGQYDLTVVWNPSPAANGAVQTPEDRGWPPGYFEKTAGSILDPEFARCDEGFEMQEPLG